MQWGRNAPLFLYMIKSRKEGMFMIEVVGGSLYQWVSNREVEIDVAEKITHVHFAADHSETSLVVLPYEKDNKVYAQIPNILLIDCCDIVAFAVVSTGED